MKEQLRDLDFTQPLLNVTTEGDNQLGFQAGPWEIQEKEGTRRMVGPLGASKYRIEKGQLQVEFEEGRFRGTWTLTKTRTL